jgi:DNA-binding transcriptional LysR family regulator
MNLRGVDLNLLAILDALLDEASVSRAGLRLGLSQPAASQALQRCRDLFGDPLLERVGGGMRLTPRADALRLPVKAILGEVEQLLGDEAPDVAALVQTVRVMMADPLALHYAPPLLARLRQSAPGITLVIEPWLGGQTALDAMARGSVDLALSLLPPVDRSFHREELLREEYVVAMARDHPAAAEFDLGRWLAYPHVVVSSEGKARGQLDETLEARGLSRRVGLVVSNFLLVPPVLKQTDLIALMPRGALPRDDAAIVTFEPPIPVEGFPLHLGWHARRGSDPGVMHVAGLIRAVMEYPRSP